MTKQGGFSVHDFTQMPVSQIVRVLRRSRRVVFVYDTAPRDQEGADRLTRALDQLGAAWKGETDD